MKRILKYIIMFMLIIPFGIKALTINEAKEIAENYLETSTYKNTYKLYMILNDNSHDFLSEEEYEKTKSYLFDGYAFFGKDNKILSEGNETNPKVKIVEQLKPGIKVNGEGTSTNPWIFSPNYIISIKTNKYGTIALEEDKNKHLNSVLLNTVSDDNSKIYLFPELGYSYINNTCKFTYVSDENGEYLKTENINNNINCEITFGKKEYTITYNLNGGTVSSVNKTTYNIETSDFTLNNPTRSGYEFKGWTGSNGTTPSTSVKITKGSTGNKTYTANWESNSYAITFNCNGGSGSTDTLNMTGASTKLTKSGCYKNTVYGTSGNKYKFIGWSKSSTATTVDFTDAQTVSSSNLPSATTLYAVYEKFITYNGSYEFINDGNNNWRIKLLSTGNLSLSDSTSVDVFLVGGGGGGGITSSAYTAAGGGAGGYVNTYKSITLSAKTSYTSTVGLGGSRGNPGTKTWFISSGTYYANGGESGSNKNGGSGGSGGGGGAALYYGCGSSGGQNGGNGQMGNRTGAGQYGNGDGKSKHEFGESSGTLYASGGSGGAGTASNTESDDGTHCNGYGTAGISAGAGFGGGFLTSPSCYGNANGSICGTGGNAENNTGSGGGGGRSKTTSGSWNSGSGGSGIIVIRNHR